jgi:translation initiation factor IF-2-like protein
VANHLTPSELAEELHMKRQEVIGKCMQMGIPIFHGRIDKSLFETSLRSMASQHQGREARTT